MPERHRFHVSLFHVDASCAIFTGTDFIMLNRFDSSLMGTIHKKGWVPNNETISYKFGSVCLFGQQ